MPFVPPGMNNHGNFIVQPGRDVRVAGAAGRSIGRGNLPRLRRGRDPARRRRAQCAACASATWAWPRTVRTSPAYRRASTSRRKRHRAGRRRARPSDQASGRSNSSWTPTAIRRLIRSASRNSGRCRKAARRRARSCTRWAGRPTAHTYGGSFVYHLDNDRVAVGYCQRPGLRRSGCTSPTKPSSNGRTIPASKPLLEGGTILSAGARAIVTGGWQSLPKVEMPGALLIGDTAGLLNVPKIKGTHQAIRSGMLAAEHIARRCRPAHRSAGFDAKLRASAAMKELKQGPQHQARFQERAVFGMINAGWETITAGLSPWTWKMKPDWSSLDKVGEAEATTTRLRRTHPAAARSPAGVYYAATEHDEDQPVHLQSRATPASASPPAPRNTTTPARASAPPACTKSSEDADGAANACRSTPPIACTARPATSRIPTRSSLG